ncbi:MAG: reverse transcriptase [Deltaproteobacteria bacterium]|nr:MAG: reverse transcriptase [Deltaproteobacteria bacterium]
MMAAKEILELRPDQAKDFLLRPKSYCSVDLPNYFVFEDILRKAAKYLNGRNIADLYHSESNPRDCEGVNHLLLSNKDGKHAWRPFELIHPALYCHFVDVITTSENWESIISRFKEFANQDSVLCTSIPLQSVSETKDRETQILSWWTKIEQKSLELALEYEVIAHTDITDCYGQIYTHSIAWALHGRDKAKKNTKDMGLVGNVIDRIIEAMRNGQTNGIPQGSVLMDFVAEMVLGYADILLARKLQSPRLIAKKDYRILRYRDDYRVFTHSKYDAEKILKALTEVLIELGLKVNSAKTFISDEVIRASIKQDKLGWLLRKQTDGTLQKHLLIIHDHARLYPNSGSLLRGLSDVRQRLDNVKECNNAMVLISIVADIAFNNPRTYPICAAILSRLMRFLSSNQQKSALEKIVRKFSRIPNTGYLEIWIQRIALPLGVSLELKEPLCDIAAGNKKDSLWNNQWIGSKVLCSLMRTSIVDKQALKDAEPIIPADEVELFLGTY